MLQFWSLEWSCEGRRWSSLSSNSARDESSHDTFWAGGFMEFARKTRISSLTQKVCSCRNTQCTRPAPWHTGKLKEIMLTKTITSILNVRLMAYIHLVAVISVIRCRMHTSHLVSCMFDHPTLTVFMKVNRSLQKFNFKTFYHLLDFHVCHLINQLFESTL